MIGTLVLVLAAITGAPPGHEEFRRELASAPSEAKGAELEAIAARLAAMPGAAAALLELRAEDARARADPDPTSTLPRLAPEQSETLARVAPRIARDEVLIAVSDGARSSAPDVPWRAAALDLLRGHATVTELDLVVDLVRDAQGDFPREGPLVEGFRDCLASVLHRDARAIGRLQALAEGAHPLEEAIVQAAGLSGDPEAVPWIASRLHDPALAGDALQAIVRLAPSVPSDRRPALASALRPFLGSPEASARRHAIRALEALRDGACVPALVERLDQGERGERKAAHAALVSLTGQRLPDRAAEWRQWLAAELAWIETERPRALEALHSANEAEVVVAVRTLSLHGLDRDASAAALAQLLREHASAPVRGQACLALERLRSRTGLEDLAGALQDADPAVGAHALAALRAITGLDLAWDAGAWRTALRAIP